jgi:hypothetical protein
MRFEALMDGRDESPLYQYCADTLASLLPKAIEYGIATADEFDVESIPERLRTEMNAVKLCGFEPRWKPLNRANRINGVVSAFKRCFQHTMGASLGRRSVKAKISGVSVIRTGLSRMT